MSFHSRDGRFHQCSELAGTIDRVWIGSDDSGVVIATAQGTNWLSRDECRTWRRLPIEGALGAVEVSGGIMTAVLVARDPRLHFSGYRQDLLSGAGALIPLDGENLRAAFDDEGFLGLGVGLATYDRAGTQVGDRAFANQEVLAACRHGPVLTATEVYRPSEFTFYCRLNAYGPDGSLWWSHAGVPSNCSVYEQAAVCADKTRLFVDVAGVLLEVRQQGLKPLAAQDSAAAGVSAALDGEVVRLLMGDDNGVATLTAWSEEEGWSWLGLGSERGRNEVNLFALGALQLRMTFGVARNGCAGFRIDDAETGREITTVAQRCIDTGPPQVPRFRQLNAPVPMLLFNSADDCQLLTLDEDQSAAAFPCNPLGTFIRAGVIVDSASLGRWVVYEVGQSPRESLLVEDFGRKVKRLGHAGPFVFDDSGSPLQTDTVATDMVGSSPRLGFLTSGLERDENGDEVLSTRFVPFHGPESVWRHSELIAGSQSGFLLRTREGLRVLVFEPEAK